MQESDLQRSRRLRHNYGYMSRRASQEMQARNIHQFVQQRSLFYRWMGRLTNDRPAFHTPEDIVLLFLHLLIL